MNFLMFLVGVFMFLGYFLVGFIELLVWCLYPSRKYDRRCIEEALHWACHSGCDVMDATRANCTLGPAKRTRELNELGVAVTLKITVVVDLVWLHVDLPKGFSVPERVRVVYVLGQKRFAKVVLRYVRSYLKKSRKRNFGLPDRVPFETFMVEVSPSVDL